MVTREEFAELVSAVQTLEIQVSSLEEERRSRNSVQSVVRPPLARPVSLDDCLQVVAELIDAKIKAARSAHVKTEFRHLKGNLIYFLTELDHARSGDDVDC